MRHISLALALVLASIAASCSGGGTQATLSAIDILRKSDQAMGQVPSFRDERLYWHKPPLALTPNDAADVSEYRGTQARGFLANDSRGDATKCAWDDLGVKPFSEQVDGGPKTPPAQDVTLQGHELINGRSASVVSYDFDASDRNGEYTLWRTEWIDDQTYRILRMEQDASDAPLHLVDLFVYDGPLLTECPSKQSIATAEFQPRAIPPARSERCGLSGRGGIGFV